MQTKRIVVLAEGKFTPLAAKTATGVIRYSPHKTVAVIDSTQVGKTVEDVLGYGGKTPIVASIQDALKHDPDVLLIGIAPTGGQLPHEWRRVVLDAIEHHLEIWSGLHFFLSNDEEFAEFAAQKNVRVWDVRRPGPDLRVATGAALDTRAFVVLTVGSDCNVGKMTVALELQRRAREKGYKASFVATGQTGILIAGEGTPLDAVPGDFMPGEVERFVMQYDEEGADVIFVEGQGALWHPGFGPVTLGLILGSMADAYVLCHQSSRLTYRPDYDVEIPPLPKVIEGYEALMQVYKAPKVQGICLNTYDLTADEALAVIEKTGQDMGLPTVDPIRQRIDPIFETLEPQILRKRASR